MAVVNKGSRTEAAPALFRLLADSAMSRAALAACGFPLALVDAAAPTRPLTYVNPAFEGFFGYRASDVLGRPLSTVLFKGEEALVHRLLAEPSSRWELKCWGKDGEARYVELALGEVRSTEGRVTHWVASFADRADVERLRAELDALKGPAA